MVYVEPIPDDRSHDTSPPKHLQINVVSLCLKISAKIEEYILDDLRLYEPVSSVSKNRLLKAVVVGPSI